MAEVMLKHIMSFTVCHALACLFLFSHLELVFVYRYPDIPGPALCMTNN